MIAHVAGVPVEELLLLAPASGAGAGLLLARARLMLRPGRRAPKRPCDERGRSPILERC
jgi:hypothetical protein